MVKHDKTDKETEKATQLKEIGTQENSVGFVDSRAETNSLKSIQLAADTSSKSSTVHQLQQTANNSLTIQREVDTSSSPSLTNTESIDAIDAIATEKRMVIANDEYLEVNEGSMAGREAITFNDLTEEEKTGLINESLADDDDEQLFSAADGKRHDLMTKASKVLTGKESSEEFHKNNKAYGILGVGEGNADPSTDVESPEADMPIGRLAPFLMEKAVGSQLKKAYHVATSKGGAESVAMRVDGKFHNEAGRFGGGFHVASSIPTGAMEVDHHKDDWKKADEKKAKDDGLSEEDQKDAFNAGEEIKPTNYLTYDVLLDAGDIVDATGPLTAMVMNKPKEIERAAREDKKDGILYKSSRGPGLALVLFKNYNKILKIVNKTKAMGDPDKFSEKDEKDREKTRTAKASDTDRLEDRNPTTKISNKLTEKSQEK